MHLRQIVLDTETTGLEPSAGHRIIEIGCVELIDRRPTGNNFHRYLQPDREIDAGARDVHGLTNEFLADKPRFHDIVRALLDYLSGAELVIHNADFDIGFLNHELGRLGTGLPPVTDSYTVLDTLTLARRLHPGQRNSLDALCKRYGIDNSRRDHHGALLDAEILADVYLAMTGGQTSLSLDGPQEMAEMGAVGEVQRLAVTRPGLRVVRPSAEEMENHEGFLERIAKASGGRCCWRTSS